MAATDMYNLKPIYSDVNVEIPSCMYQMKSLHGKSESVMELNEPDLKSLVDKERKITADLQLLTEELKNLSAKLGHTFGESSPLISKKVDKVTISDCNLPEGISDFVVSVSPVQPALSAVLIGELLRSNGIHVATPTQRHSSLKDDIPENYLAAMGGLSGRIQQHVEKVVLTFIWKYDPFCPYLMQSPLRQTKIIGDANIGRYLCRILCPNIYNENNVEQIAIIDKWVDASVQMTNGNTKEKDAVLKSMNSHLGKNEMFCSPHLTLADITLFAALLTNINQFKSIPKNVKKWFVQMSKYFHDTVSKFNVPDSWIAL